MNGYDDYDVATRLRRGNSVCVVEDGLQELDPGAELHYVRDLADDLVLLVLDAVLCSRNRKFSGG